MILLVKRVRRRIHRALVSVYLKIKSRRSFYQWKKEEKTSDIHLIKGLGYGFMSISPIHISSWHYQTKYFKLDTGKELIFIKKLKNDDLARREIEFYSKAEESNTLIVHYIPKFYCSIKKGGYTYIFTEYIEGIGFDKIDFEHYGKKEELCVNLSKILDALNEMGYKHNDIRLKNFILRENSPFLFDFGYACLSQEQSSMLNSLSSQERKRLNEYNRIALDSHDDAYSMYYVMKHINPSLLSTQIDIWSHVNALIDC